MAVISILVAKRIEAAVVTPVEWTILIESDDCILLRVSECSSIQVARGDTAGAADALECLDALIAASVLQEPNTFFMGSTTGARARSKALCNVIHFFWRYCKLLSCMHPDYCLAEVACGCKEACTTFLAEVDPSHVAVSELVRISLVVIRST